ncbi:hypothetical protein LE190_16115 [Massilia oculi]|uniref:Uncharacterized protein n=1 Tax=Massilia hydrophila TaxID=3044279 RepID=A0ABS7YGS2_9BURK|nr:hypothetical protein [Massilia oculi]MCA1857439.1 hypothetical protein [Massilia oculi]
MILGQHIGKELCDALSLPKYTIGFTLRARVGELVTIECEYVPDDQVCVGDFTVALAQYHLTPANDRAKAVRHPAEVMGYQAWLAQRNEDAHCKYMARTSCLP